MTATETLPTIKFGNMHLANGKAVAFPASTGVHMGRGFNRFALKSLDCGQLGNDAFTEVYFTTESGNVYRISQPKNGFGGHEPYWCMVSISHKASGAYRMSDVEITVGVLEVGKPFRYGPGWSSKVQAILCVNASRCYGKVNAEFVSDIRNEFNRMVA